MAEPGDEAPSQRPQDTAPVADQPQEMAEAGKEEAALDSAQKMSSTPPPSNEDPVAPPLEVTEATTGAPEQTDDSVGQAPPQMVPDAAITAAEQAATLPPPSSQACEPGKQQLPALPAPQQEQEQEQEQSSSSVHKEEEKEPAAPVQEGGGGKSRARRLWDRLRDAVHRQFHPARSKTGNNAAAAPPPDDKGSDTKTSEPEDGNNKPPASLALKEEEKPMPAPAKNKDGVPADPAKEKAEDEAPEAPHQPERRKSQRRAESTAVAGEDAGSEGATEQQCPPPPVKKLQRAGKRLLRIMSWYNRHRSPPPPTEEGKVGETIKPPTTPGQDKDKGEAQEEVEPAGKLQPAPGGGPEPSRPVKKLQKAVKRLLRVLSWYNRNRSSSQMDQEPSGPATAEEEKDGDTTKPPPTTALPEEDGEKDSKVKPEPATAPGQEKEEGSEPGEKGTKPHPKWAEEEKRLENILEDAFTRLLAPEYKAQLSGTTQRCLLTFSVFELASEVKKQAMIYWWVAQFNLPYYRWTGDPHTNKKPGRSSVVPGGGGRATAPADLPTKPGKSSVPGSRTMAPTAGTDLPAAPPDKNKLGAEGIVAKLTHLGISLPCGRSTDPRNKNSSSVLPHKSATRGGGHNLDAEVVLSQLSNLGFLEPIKNYCCGAIHGCKVNPLVHWMVKRMAKDDRFADLDEDGRPTTSQTSSGILCLTAGYRNKLQKMRISELQKTVNVAKPSRTPSSTTGPEEPTQAKNEPSRVSSTKSPTKTDEMMENNDVATMAKIGSKRAAALPRQTEVEEQTQMIEKKGEASSMTKTKSKAMKRSSLSRQQEDEEDQTQGVLDTSPNVHIEDIKGKQVILNVDAHVYPFSKSLFEHLSDSLTVLQLGRWCHHDDKTYMEVDGLESLCAINKLKKIRYLSLRGLSRLTKLPCGIQNLKSLEILDMRGCQNLVNVETKDIKPLKCLTHIDLTECYMLEHIGRGITTLSNLQVFKGFVFGTGTQGNTGCKVNDLRKLTNLRKLTMSITTDANLKKDDMAELKSLMKLRSLTITWSEIPQILAVDKVKDKLTSLLSTWTNFELPPELEKLDLRCYPKKDLQLKNPKHLKKLYIRGGDMETFSIPEENIITTLRLRYLKKFIMKWDDIISMLKKIEHVEIRMKDEKLLKFMGFDEKDKKILKKEIEDEQKILEKMMIPKYILDENGVWMKDSKEEKNQQGIINQPNSKDNEDAKAENKT